MGRRPKSKVQDFSFPLVESAVTDAELDASIDSADDKGKELKEDAQRKKEISKAIKEMPQIFSAEQVAWVFTAYVMLLSFAYSYVLKSDYEAIFAELDIDERTKMEMAKPLAKIASKYAPANWAGMTDEIQLISQVGIYTATSFGRAKLIVQREQEKKQRQASERRNMPHVQPQQAAATV